MILRSNQCILFNEDRIYSEIYRKSPLVRGNKLWKQLSSDKDDIRYHSGVYRGLLNMFKAFNSILISIVTIAK